MKREGLQRQKLTKQRSKLLCRQGGGELDDLMYGSMIEKMRIGGNAKRNAYNNETGEETTVRIDEFEVTGTMQLKNDVLRQFTL